MNQYVPPRPIFIDSEEAAAALGVSVATVRRLVLAHKLENHGTDRRLKLDLAQVDDYQRSRSAGSR